MRWWSAACPALLSPLVFLLCFPPLRCFVVCAGCATIGGSLLVGWGVGGAAIASVRRCRCWALASSLRVVAVQSGQSASNCVHVSQYECSCRAASNFRLRCLRPIFLRGGPQGRSVLDIAKYHEQLDQLHRTPSCTSSMTRELFDCVDDPFLKAQRPEILQMRKECSGPPNRPGDGHCPIMSLAQYQRDSKDDGRDCRSKAVREMLDCVDDPLVASQRSGILRLQRRCKIGNAQGGH